MTRLKLAVKKRDLLGRKVKKLRLKGILPANVYGKKVKSQAVQLEAQQFMPAYREAGETGLIDLLIEGSEAVKPVLVHNVQLDPVTGNPIHVDFHQVALTEKVKAEIPVELIGESLAAQQKIGILVKMINEVEIEALPTDLPEKIEVDISSLEKVGDMIKVGEMKIDAKKMTLLTDTSRLAVKIEPPTKAEEEKPVEAEAEGEEAVEEGMVEGEGEKVTPESAGEAPTKEGAGQVPAREKKEKAKEEKKGK